LSLLDVSGDDKAAGAPGVWVPRGI